MHFLSCPFDTRLKRRNKQPSHCISKINIINISKVDGDFSLSRCDLRVAARIVFPWLESLFCCISYWLCPICCCCCLPLHIAVLCVSQACVCFQHRWKHLLFRGWRGAGRGSGGVKQCRGVGGGRGGGLGCGRILSRFKQAQNKRPVERKVRGRQSVYNLAYCDSFFT